MLSSLLLAAASSYDFLSRGMAFGPYDPALYGLSNELPYVSPERPLRRLDEQLHGFERLLQLLYYDHTLMVHVHLA